MSSLATILTLGICFTVLACFVLLVVFLSVQRIRIDRNPNLDDDDRDDA